MIFSQKVGFFKNMFPPSDWLPRPLGCKFIMFLTFSEISRTPFFLICDILESEVVGSRDTFQSQIYQKKVSKRENLTILWSDITKIKKIRLNYIIKRLLGSQSDHLYAKYVPKIKAIVSIQLRFQVNSAKSLYSYGCFT